MKKKLRNRIVSPLIIAVLIVSFLSGCGNEVGVSSSDYKGFITVDVFCSRANYQGLQAGWFAEVVREKFNMELNIIAPNVAGGGDTLFQTRFAAGSLGDIVMMESGNGRLEDSVTAGLLLDMSEYSDIMPNAIQYTEGVEMLQTLIGDDDGIYAFPASVSSYPATEPSGSTEPTFGPYLRWDLYTEIGTPKMETLEDLLPVLKAMQQIYPETENGKKVYGFSLFKDWDDNMMMMAKQPACFYGYDEVGFVLSKADGSDNQSIIDDDSAYIRSLQLFFEANQMGLVDPDSSTQDWTAVWDKCANGELLFSPWPWLGQAAYNTNDNLSEGKGFMIASIDDMQIYSYGAQPAGDKYVIAIGEKAQDPERMAAFIDWLYSPEGIMMSTSQTGSTCGPEGLTWEMIDGEPHLTDFGIMAMLEGGAQMPEEWGGGQWSEGYSQLNFLTVLPKDINPETGFSYDFRLWDSYIEFTSTPVHESWQAEMGAMTTFEYLIDNNKILVAAGTDYIMSAEPSGISTLREQCKTIIVEYSWKMVFAEDEDEFKTLLKYMQNTLDELGYDEVLQFDMQVAFEQSAARSEAEGN